MAQRKSTKKNPKKTGKRKKRQSIAPKKKAKTNEKSKALKPTNTPMSTPELKKRLDRDEANAVSAKRYATEVLKGYSVNAVRVNFKTGITSTQRAQLSYSSSRLQTYRAISHQSFHAMLEVKTEMVDNRSGLISKKQQLWYANTQSETNESLGEAGSVIYILAWTHPGVQLALSGKVGEHKSIHVNGLRLVGLTPIARARFDSVYPEISGLYEPGGAVRPKEKLEQPRGLKPVKLNMTPEQVDAFISRMDGLMIVTGAPGSGKTTVAFQRIRFLIDQQDERQTRESLPKYAPELTRIFLANPNLVTFSRVLLDQLSIPRSTVSLVDNFVTQYLDQVWPYKHDARPRQRRLDPFEHRARAAFYGLATPSDLRGLWQAFERQVAHRIGDFSQAEWARVRSKSGEASPADYAVVLSQATQALKGSIRNSDPLRSRIRLDRLYQDTRVVYERVRSGLATQERQRFDNLFSRWLFWVYDPLAAVASYFGTQLPEGAERMSKGTDSRVNEAQVFDAMKRDWDSRQFGPEECSWLAWLLRFALPETGDSQGRFREMPHALSETIQGGNRWSHVVIDEAQDLCVSEASLLVSFVDPQGAATVSADFRQIVSPVRGMTDMGALEIGTQFKSKTTQYPFARNMRQSRQIGLFLQKFYQAAFREQAQFEVNNEFDDTKPELLISRGVDHPLHIRRRLNVLSRSRTVRSIAILQINEDEEAMRRLRSALEGLGVELAPPWKVAMDGKLTTSSVERIKGLEFDACFVVGLDQVGRTHLNFTMNRAYVALSRPTRRLALLCQDFPALLQNIDRDLFTVVDAR